MHSSLINAIFINKENQKSKTNTKKKNCYLYSMNMIMYRQKYKQFKLWVVQQTGDMMPKTT